MMDDLWNGQRFSNDTVRPELRPAMDVVENENGVSIRVDLPGIAPEDVNIEVEGNLLTISGSVESAVENEGERYHYQERRSGSFKRSLRLAETLDTENAEATFENGVLNLTLPKRPEAQPKRIKVETV
jgi:HSP20 family protein